MDVVLPTLAVALFWLFWGLVLAGCGFLLRRLLGRAMPGQPAGPTLLAVDIWIGLAGVVAYLLLWNLLLPITWAAGLVPIVAGALGLAAGGRRLSRPQWQRTSSAAIGTVGVICMLWLANASLAVADDYDFGLYHLNLIDYAKRYATVPGLANLHVRLGAGDAHLLFVALLDRGPLSGAGPHLADGLLASLLLFDLLARFAFRPASTWFTSFTSTLGLLLISTTVIVAALRPTQRISSPNLDFAAFVLVVVGALYLAQCAEEGFRAPAALGATPVLATASATRPLYWLWVLFAIVVLVLLTKSGRRRRALSLLAVGALPAVMAAGWLARQSVLSGYPLYPLTLGGLPVDWRLPAHLLRAATRVDYAWAREPGVAPDTVFGSWRWLPHHWLGIRVRDQDVILPTAILAVSVVILLARGVGSTWRERRRATLIVVVPSLVSIAIWFATIPDPRFVWAPIWLVSLALLACVLPPQVSPPRWYVVVGALGFGVALAIFESRHRVYFVPAVFLAVALAAVVVGLSQRSKRAGSMRHAVPWFVLTLLVAELGAASVTRAGGIHVVVANHAGRIGIPADPVPVLVRVRTPSGLVVSHPAHSDQCWQALVCVPRVLGDGLRLRGRNVADGFSLRPAQR